MRECWSSSDQKETTSLEHEKARIQLGPVADRRRCNNCARTDQRGTRKLNLVNSSWSVSALLRFTDLNRTSLPSQGMCQKPKFTGLREPLQSSLSRSQRGNGSTDLRMRRIASVAPLIRRCFCRLFRRILM